MADGSSSANTSGDDSRNILSAEVESLVSLPGTIQDPPSNIVQAKHMEDNRLRIETIVTETRPFRWSCGPESIRRLMHDSPFDPPLIDIIVAQSKSGQPVYLGSVIYAEIQKSGFGDSKRLVSGISRDRNWLFPIYRGAHCSALTVNWRQRRCGYYDHRHWAGAPRPRRDMAIKVSTQTRFASYWKLISRVRSGTRSLK
jgi:hypothetical protein